jgi:hypothetical protein
MAKSGTLDGIVDAAVSGLVTQTDLALLEGHVALHISSGNKELDTKLGKAVADAFPNFASRADTVRREDLYQMTVKVYQENKDVIAVTNVSGFAERNVAEQTVVIRGIEPRIVQTLQYRTATLAKNEFDRYLDTAFAGTGAVVAEAEPLPPPPPPPPKELPAWIQPDIRFETAWCDIVLPPWIGFSPKAFVLGLPIMIFNFYVNFQFGFPFNGEGASGGMGICHFGYLLRYNDHFYIPVSIGPGFVFKGQDEGESTVGFIVSAGVMKLWKIGRWDFLDPVRVFTAVKFNLGTDTNNVLTNTLILSVGLVYDIGNRRYSAKTREEP